MWFFDAVRWLLGTGALEEPSGGGGHLAAQRGRWQRWGDGFVQPFGAQQLMVPKNWWFPKMMGLSGKWWKMLEKAGTFLETFGWKHVGETFAIKMLRPLGWCESWVPASQALKQRLSAGVVSWVLAVALAVWISITYNKNTQQNLQSSSSIGDLGSAGEAVDWSMLPDTCPQKLWQLEHLLKVKLMPCSKNHGISDAIWISLSSKSVAFCIHVAGV